ncbi:D-alanyl-D-alanine carboxypeptidase, partial [Streptomyces sp. B1866]
MLLSGAPAGPAFAAASPTATPAPPPGSPSATPPATTSTVGGEQLGRSGPQVAPGLGAPALPRDLSARSWLVADAESGQVLAAQNAHWRLPPASTLKMLFADTVLPKLPRGRTHKVQPSDLAGMGSGSSLVGVKEDYTYSAHDLWLGVFLRSGNDAVHVLSAMNGGKARTVREMQRRADELNAHDTHVVSPDGYDEPGQVSSAYDLTLFARAGLQNADFREYCSTANARFPGEVKKDRKGKLQREYFDIQNTDRLLTGDYDLKPYPGLAGVKNGSTTNAGSTFTGVAQRGDRVLLVTVMNPAKREHNEVYREAARLLDWGFAAAGRVTPVGVLVPPGPDGADGSHGMAGGGTAGDDGKPGRTGAGGDDGKADPGSGRSAASARSGGSGGGMWTALGIAGGSVVALAALALVVRRRWPLPRDRG